MVPGDMSNTIIWGTFDYVGFIIFGVIQCTCLKMAYNLTTAGFRAKQSEIWDLGALVAHIWGTFDLVRFKVIFGSFSALVSKWLVTRKRLIIQ